MSLTVFAFTTFIAGNPGFIAVLLAGMSSLIVMLVGAYWALIATRLKSLEAADAAMAKELHDYIQQQDSEVANAIRGVTSKLTEFQLENVAAHASITERIVRVEAKMPNGQITKIMKGLERLLAQSEAGSAVDQ